MREELRCIAIFTALEHFSKQSSTRFRFHSSNLSKNWVLPCTACKPTPHREVHAKNRNENLLELLSSHSSKQMYQLEFGNRTARPACCSAQINSASDPGAKRETLALRRPCKLPARHSHQKMLRVPQTHRADFKILKKQCQIIPVF